MEQDYIDILLEYLADHRLDAMGSEYFLQEKREDAAAKALEATLSKEQTDLFLVYEEARNASSGIAMDTAARQAFLLARKIFR